MTMFMESTYSFFAFEVPQTIIICIVMNRIFKLSQAYPKIRKYTQKFFFLKTIIILILLEQNLTYLTYLFFGQLNISFSFKLADKLSLVFTSMMGFCYTFFTFTFYLLLRRFKKIKAIKEFNSGVHLDFYGHTFLLIKNTFRSFLNGAVFYLLKDSYALQMLVLSAIDLETIIMIIIFQYHMKRSLFQKKASFCLCILYHLLFLCLNFTFVIDYYLEKYSIEANVFEGNVLQLQTAILFLISANVFAMFIIELIPYNDWTKRSQKRKRKLQKKKNYLSSLQNNLKN